MVSLLESETHSGVLEFMDEMVEMNQSHNLSYTHLDFGEALENDRKSKKLKKSKKHKRVIDYACIDPLLA